VTKKETNLTATLGFLEVHGQARYTFPPLGVHLSFAIKTTECPSDYNLSATTNYETPFSIGFFSNANVKRASVV
jgi:hypothetical protein